MVGQHQALLDQLHELVRESNRLAAVLDALADDLSWAFATISR
jgi:hypothetical protein